MGNHKRLTTYEVNRFLRFNRQRRLLYALLVALSFFALGVSAETNESTLQIELGSSDSDTAIIGLGESLRLEVRKSSKIHISDGGILRARSIGSSVILTGRRTGRTSMRFFAPQNSDSPQDRTVYVTERKVAEAARRFHRYLATRRGLKLDTSALPQVVVTGELLRLEDWENLVAIAKTHRIAWRLEANTFPLVRKRSSAGHRF
jgi:hypothetical protein